MAAPDLVGVFIRPLEALGIPYMVTGGVAAVVYGDPRFTRDIDIVLWLAPEDAEKFSDAFDPEAFYVPPLDTLRVEAARRQHGHFNVIDRDSALRADVYLGGSDPLHAWAFDRRRRLALDRGFITLAPPEYVIVRKLEYYRDSGSDRHIRDIGMMLQLSSDQIDQQEIEHWIKEFDLGAEWREARGF